MLHPPFEIHVGAGIPRARLAVGGHVGTPVDGGSVPHVAGEPSLPLPALLSTTATDGIPALLVTATGSTPARWLAVPTVEAALALDPAGVFIAVNGEAVDLATNTTHALRRLPRVLLRGAELLADNADVSTSMAALLEDFTRDLRTRQGAPGFPHLCIATGYLYAGGMERVLRLLEIPGVETVRLLFSGETDLKTRRALLHRELGDAVDEIEPAAWSVLHAAVQAGRLDVRVYGDAFLHAKLYLAHDGLRDDDERGGRLSGGIAVIGSSNVSSAGLAAGGNLELDVTLRRDPDLLTSLLRWFDGRWEESYAPDPELLSVLDAHRPPPPPVFKTPGVAEVYAAGLEGRFVGPERHLALLHGLYAGRYGTLPPVVITSFPPAPDADLAATPEQEDGAANLINRLVTVRLAFLADSVGLGKTLTALGTAWGMKQAGLATRVALIAPRKLWDQWERDANTFGLPWDMLRLVNRHILERDEPDQAAARLDDADLLIVEEAHESLRSRTNRLWLNLRRYLRDRPGCRVLLVSATPWNNRREDIFNYLLLAWQDGRPLEDRYPGLRDFSREMTCFGELPPARGARWFEELGAETGYRRLFDAAFVQRTRSMLERHYGGKGYPLRKPVALQTPLSAAHDALFIALTTALAELNLPYREPMRAFVRAAAPAEAPGLGNFQKSLLLQLFKRAESSTFALAVSLANTARQLAAFGKELGGIAAAEHPSEALMAWVRARAGTDEDEDEDLSGLSSSEQGCATQLLAVLRAGDDVLAASIVRTVLTEQVEPDQQLVESLRGKVTFELDARSPKELQLYRKARDAYEAGHKPILVAAYADTAVRMFIRLVAQLPDATIGLALGGDEAWVSTPTEHTRIDVTPSEWAEALDLAPRERRLALFRKLVARATPADRDLVLNRFAPRARGQSLAPGAHIDILVGSEAISVGQNLQDSTSLIQLDLPWNPMVIEQRIGRIDRRGGGRSDPAIPGGQPVVDVVYCWSSEAVERAVKLRDKLMRKATGALADTRFDELLLDELHAQVMAKRAVNGDSFLAVQRRAADQAAGGAGTGSEVDALRQLAAWASSWDVPAEAPVVAAGVRGPGGWLLTIEAAARGPRGEALGTFHRSVGAEAAAPALGAADLELVVRRLVGGAARENTATNRRTWTRACLALDVALVAWADRARTEHNTEVDRHDASRLATPTPNEKLRGLLAKAAAIVRTAGLALEKDPAVQGKLRANKDRIDFLFKEVLAPLRVHELLSHGQEEERARNALEAIQLVPCDFLTTRFDELFEDLCGARWAATRSSSMPQPALLAAGLDGRWHTLSVRLLAATWCAS